MKVALVHDHLMQAGGAERVLEELAELYPDAPIYILFYDEQALPRRIDKNRLRPSRLQMIPGLTYFYQALLPLMPQAVESWDFSDFDVVISSASSFAKGVKKDKAIHICYCHTPTRFLWGSTGEYVRSLKYPMFVKRQLLRLLPRLREWDLEAARNIDVMVSNSHEVSKRISKHYGLSSTLIYPPVNTSSYGIAGEREYFLTGGRLVGYKRFDTVVKAFTRLKMPLKIFGTGPDLRYLKKMAGPNIEFLGYVDDDTVRRLYCSAKAFIHPQHEDFGISAVEAMAAGCPVIAYGAGGALETVLNNETGIFYDEQSWEAIADTILRFKSENFDTEVLKEHANNFNGQRFKDEMMRVVNEAYENRD